MVLVWLKGARNGNLHDKYLNTSNSLDKQTLLTRHLTPSEPFIWSTYQQPLRMKNSNVVSVKIGL